MGRIIYIVEGEIEERFLKQKIRFNDIIAGKVYVFNLMQKLISDSSCIMTRKCDKVFCILDTDVVEKKNMEYLQKNCKKLKELSNNIFLMAQTKNFEDELRFMLNTKDIASTLGIKYANVRTIKLFLAQTVEYSRVELDLNKYCQRAIDFEETIKHHGICLVKGVRIADVSQCKK